MASGSVILNPALSAHPTRQPQQAYLEAHEFYDAANPAGLPVTRTLMTFRKDNPVNPEWILDGIVMTPLWDASSNINVLFNIAAESPIVAGNAYFGVAFERMQPSTTNAVLYQNNWGTEVLGAIAIATAQAGQATQGTIALTPAQVGVLAGESYRVRIRRLNQNVLDTVPGIVYLLGVRFVQA